MRCRKTRWYAGSGARRVALISAYRQLRHGLARGAINARRIEACRANFGDGDVRAYQRTPAHRRPNTGGFALIGSQPKK